jgi:hypothetical protein
MGDSAKEEISVYSPELESFSVRRRATKPDVALTRNFAEGQMELLLPG